MSRHITPRGWVGWSNTTAKPTNCNIPPSDDEDSDREDYVAAPRGSAKMFSGGTLTADLERQKYDLGRAGKDTRALDAQIRARNDICVAYVRRSVYWGSSSFETSNSIVENMPRRAWPSLEAAVREHEQTGGRIKLEKLIDNYAHLASRAP